MMTPLISSCISTFENSSTSAALATIKSCVLYPALPRSVVLVTRTVISNVYGTNTEPTWSTITCNRLKELLIIMIKLQEALSVALSCFGTVVYHSKIVKMLCTWSTIYAQARKSKWTVPTPGVIMCLCTFLYKWTFFLHYFFSLYCISCDLILFMRINVLMNIYHTLTNQTWHSTTTIH